MFLGLTAGVGTKLNRVKCNLTQLHSLSGVAQHCVGMELPLGFMSSVGWCLPHLQRGVSPWGAFLGRLWAVLAVSGSLAYQVCACACPRGLDWLSVQCGGVHVLSSISPPSSPYSGEEGPLLNRLSIDLTVQCDECLF